MNNKGIRKGVVLVMSKGGSGNDNDIISIMMVMMYSLVIIRVRKLM